MVKRKRSSPPSPSPWRRFLPFLWRRESQQQQNDPAEESTFEQNLPGRDDDLPDGWVEIVDPDSGDLYYYHEEACAVSWDKPTCNHPMVKRKRTSPSPWRRFLPFLSPQQPQKNPPATTPDHSKELLKPSSLPEFWKEARDPRTGEIYYFHSLTRETTWKRPTALGARRRFKIVRNIISGIYSGLRSERISFQSESKESEPRSQSRNGLISVPNDDESRSKSHNGLSSVQQDDDESSLESCSWDYDKAKWELGTFPEGDVQVPELRDKTLVNAIVDGWNNMMASEIRKGETYGQRFKKLKKLKRNNKLDEKHHIHPFINGILRTFFRIYIAAIQPKTPNGELAAEQTYLSNSSIFLYTKSGASEEDTTKPVASDKFIVERKYAGNHRRPDAAFFRRGTPVDNSDDVKYDSAVREKGLLVSVEATQSHFHHGTEECKRHYAHLTRKDPASCRMRAGFSIKTDGISWYFLRINWKVYPHNQYEWSHWIEQSKGIKFKTNAQKTALAKWLLFVLDLSLLQPELSTEYSNQAFSDCNFAGSRLTKVFNAGERSMISLWKNELDGGDYVLKTFSSTSYSRDDSKFQTYFEHEVNFLRELADAENIVSLTNSHPFSVPRSFWLKHEGSSLEALDIAGKRGQQLAVLVKRDIWGGALSALRNKSICHCDIHQGNILICLKRNKAMLIDFESARKFGQDFGDSPVRHQFHRYKDAHEIIDQISVAALLESMWVPTKSHFDDKLLKATMIELRKKVDGRKSNYWSKCAGIADQKDRDEQYARLLKNGVKEIFSKIVDPILYRGDRRSLFKLQEFLFSAATTQLNPL